MDNLFSKLWENGGSDFYPYHMPGHKRHAWGRLPEPLAKLDITEIDGFDNLHRPEGILDRLQRKAAKLYGAEESFYLVNGSTAGILSAVSCALPAGGHILMCRNCHKSAYHATYLRNLTVSYLYPPVCAEYDIFDAVTAEQVRHALDTEPDIGAVLVVSPTYEGRISDIRAIAGVVHEKGIPLIVDEAHGAHLGLSEGFASNACQAGADLVIHSVHKTLPALTQAALLHVNGGLIDREYLKRFLHIYQTSSPSYILMASIDNALSHAEGEGAEAFERFRRRYTLMRERLSACRNLRFLTDDAERQDIGKLVISVKGTLLREASVPEPALNEPAIKKTSLKGTLLQENYPGEKYMDGKKMYNILRDEYHLQTEMAAGSYVLAMFTVGDSEEGFLRMERALLEIDGRLRRMDERDQAAFLYGRQETGRTALPLGTAWEAAAEYVELSGSTGRYAGEFVNLYPPGVPVLVPGEAITEEIVIKLGICLEQGLDVEGVEMSGGSALIRVLREY